MFEKHPEMYDSAGDRPHGGPLDDKHLIEQLHLEIAAVRSEAASAKSEVEHLARALMRQQRLQRWARSRERDRMTTAPIRGGHWRSLDS
jgi:hypothetical protein